MLSNSEILAAAMRQSAIDSHCSPEDFLKEENIVAVSRPAPLARKYLELPYICNLVSYGNNIVASVSEKLILPIKDYLDQYPIEHCFETPALYALNDILAPHGAAVKFMAEYFLPDVSQLRPLPCFYETRILTQEDFAPLYRPEWSNALCADRRHLDVLGIGAYDGGRLIGLAGCSADCGTMWQIGIDVLPEYRRQGIASALTSRLALEILSRGKVPFYCAAWSNIRSVRNAIKSGFRPAWADITAKGFHPLLEPLSRQKGEEVAVESGGVGEFGVEGGGQHVVLSDCCDVSADFAENMGVSPDALHPRSTDEYQTERIAGGDLRDDCFGGKAVRLAAVRVAAYRNIHHR